jgi:hypothetical protein
MAAKARRSIRVLCGATPEGIEALEESRETVTALFVIDDSFVAHPIHLNGAALALKGFMAMP